MNAYSIPGIKIENNQSFSHEYICDLILQRLYNKTMDDICIKTRKRDILELRQVVQVILSRYSDMPLTQIGFITHKDHTTVVHSRMIINECEYTRKKYNVISSLLQKYLDFENEYKKYFTINDFHFRSYKDEIINTKSCQ